MKTVQSSSVICALIAIVIAILGLLGYIPGMELLSTIGENYIPMAPSTAISFVILGLILIILNVKQISGVKTIILMIIALLVSLFGVLEVAGYLSGTDLNFEDILVPGAGTLRGIPIARMSPATGAAFFLSGVAIFFYTLRIRSNLQKSNTYIKYFKGGLGILVMFISFVFCLAYFYGTPLLYNQGVTIPMALTTALGFLFLSFSMLTSEKDAFPLSLFTGSTTRSYLLRFIFPLSTLSIILSGIIVFTSIKLFKVNPAFITATLTVLTAVITGFIAAMISRRLGSKIDRSEIALKQSHEDLSKEIEERKQVEKALQKEKESAQKYLDIAGVMLAILNEKGVITLINQKGCEILGYSYSEIINKNWFDLCIHEDIREEIKEVFHNLISGNIELVEYYENTVVNKKGELRIIAFHNSVIRNEESRITGVLFSGEDITERKQVEEDIKKHHENLEEIVKERTTELEEKNAELKRFYDTTIDRELRMKELRDENDELKKQFGQKDKPN